MTLFLLWIQLAAAAAFILGAANFLAKSADIIGFKTGLGRSFAGVVLLATATSLPELGTGISAITLFDQPDLAAGDAFGSNIFNLLIIGLLDIFWRRGPILNSVSTTSVVVGALGIVIIAVAASGVVIHHTDADIVTTVSGWFVSPVSIVIIVVFLGAMYMIYRHEQGQQQATGAEDEEEDEDHEYAADSLSRAVFTYTASAAVVVGSAIWLARTGDRITIEMGLEASFVGTQFLALSTSLPELAASFAAIRINAPDLAITNVLGSNLFNMGFVLFLDDVAYTDGALWSGISEIHLLTAAIAILMTAVVIIALVNKPRERPGKYWTLEAALLIGLYVVASVLVFGLG